MGCLKGAAARQRVLELAVGDQRRPWRFEGVCSWQCEVLMREDWAQVWRAPGRE